MSKQKKQKRSGCGHSKPKQINIKHGMNALDRIQTKERIMYDQRTDKIVDFLLQIGCDAFILSNADLYDMQPNRALEAVNTYRTYINELAAHLIDDADADEELVYFWTDLDTTLPFWINSFSEASPNTACLPGAMYLNRHLAVQTSLALT